MKLSNPFKKTGKKETKSTIQKLEKNQLEKMVGGTEAATTTVRQVATSEGPRY